jgi:hypothetical protein
MASPAVLIELQPSFSIIKGSFASHVEDYKSAMGIANVPRNQRFEPFLACRIPYLQSIILIFMRDVLGQEINADSGLNDPWSTLDVSSNLSLA